MRILSINSMTRREALTALTAFAFSGAFGCRKHFVRPSGLHDLGEVSELLEPMQAIQERAFIVFRDEQGWSAMSTRCTYDGCELSVQDRALLCVCCGSVFEHAGRVLRGPAGYPLPYYPVFYRERHLYVETNETVDASYRFTTPELEQALLRLNERIKEEGARTGKTIPDILMGTGDGNIEGIFREKIEKATPEPTFSSGFTFPRTQ